MNLPIKWGLSRSFLCRI